MENLFDELRERFSKQTQAKMEQKLLLEDPVKFFSLSYEALTEDLDKQKIKNEPFSKDWVIAKALEQEIRHLLNEETWTSKPPGQSFTFTTVALPLVRKIFSRLIAMDLVSVQPIPQPTAKIFYLDFQYGTASPGDGINKNDSVHDVAPGGYSNATEGGPVKEIDMIITDENVATVEKKLKAIWTVELEQDLAAYQGLNAEAELTSVLQQQIVREIDGMIIRALIAGAHGAGSGSGTGAGNVNWNVNGYLAGDTTTTTRSDYKRTLYEAICDASNLIFKKRFRYATWILGAPDTIVRLEKLEEFKITEQPIPGSFTIGRHLVGTLNDRYAVYKDPYYPNANQLLIGYKGTDWADTVGFYAPYIPLYVTPLIIDPNDFKPRKGLMSRFAYGTLIKDGLATVTLTSS